MIKAIKKNVFTYHAPLPGSNPEAAYKLLLLWKRAWEKQGFTATVLNESHAQKHELYVYFNRRVETLPTVNNLSYERACWLRWLAMATVGGGIMTDADVMAYDGVNKLPEFHPKEIVDRKLPSIVRLLQNHIPSVVIGSRHGYTEVVKQMIDYKVTEKDIEEGCSQPHVSDMYMFYRGGIKYVPSKTVLNYGDEGWETAPLVHYANSTLRGNKEPRWSLIPRLRAI